MTHAPKPLVTGYLVTHTFRQLEDEHGVFARRSTDLSKYSLNYDQLSIKNGDALAEQCRGLIIRPLAFRRLADLASDSWKDEVVGHSEVVAWPMNRFYNHGDPAGADLDWSSPELRVYEKLDGTCIIAYYDHLHGRWCCATRSVADADLPISAGHPEIGDATFAQLFARALVETRESSQGESLAWAPGSIDEVVHLNKELTYVFELVSPWNQIVVAYERPRVYLIAARETASGTERSIESLRLQHVMRPRTWALGDVAAVACFVDSADPSQLEGAVVCDRRGGSFLRLKVKNKSYVLAHRSKDQVTASPRNALEAVIREKLDDILPLLPEATGKRMQAIAVAYKTFCDLLDADFVAKKAAAGCDRKAFAIAVTSSGAWPTPYFVMWQDKAAGTHAWLRDCAEAGKLTDSLLDAVLSRMVVATDLKQG